MQNLGTSGEIQTLISHTSMQKEWLTLQTSISTSNGHQLFCVKKMQILFAFSKFIVG